MTRPGTIPFAYPFETNYILNSTHILLKPYKVNIKFISKPWNPSNKILFNVEVTYLRINKFRRIYKG